MMAACQGRFKPLRLNALPGGTQCAGSSPQHADPSLEVLLWT